MGAPGGLNGIGVDNVVHDTNMTSPTATYGAGTDTGANSRGLPFLASDGHEAGEFLDYWHSGSGTNGLVQLVRMKRPKPDPRAVTGPREKLTQLLRVEGLDELIYSDDHVWDVYHSIGVLKSVPARARRGGKENVSSVPGMALDFDVKDKAFRDEEEIALFIDSLPLAPSATVSTGSGGVHAYWKWPEPLSPHHAEALAQRWWALTQLIAGDEVVIDRVYNCDRILRTPGSIRWPKMNELTPGTGVSPSLVRIRGVDAGVVADPERVSTLTEDAWSRRQADLRRVRAEVHRVSVTAQDLAGEDSWSRLYIRSQLPVIFAERMTWPQILEPLGWFRLDEPPDREGRVHWARPGGDGSKSATTDWAEAPDSMSLFSTSPETGLLHLKDAGINLTKYRVYVQLWWKGDERGFVEAFMKQLENETAAGQTGEVETRPW